MSDQELVLYPSARSNLSPVGDSIPRYQLPLLTSWMEFYRFSSKYDGAPETYQKVAKSDFIFARTANDIAPKFCMAIEKSKDISLKTEFFQHFCIRTLNV